LREVLGADVDAWRISITGGDISEAALRKAESGLFGAWALRALSDAVIAKYFDRVGARSWLLKRPYRSMVRFERQNILDLLSPAAPLHWSEYDIILCRNVLIYFAPEVAVQLVEQLRSRLSTDGHLILGHAEAGLMAPMPDLPLPTEFRAALDPATAQTAIQTPAPPAELSWDISQSSSREPAPVVRDPVAPTEAEAGVEPPFGDGASGDDLALLRRLADEGDYRAASDVCGRLLARRDAPPLAYYLRAILCLVEDDAAGAETALKQALYLDREFVLAHHRLGLVCLSTGRDAAGRRSLRTALRLAARLAPDRELEGGDGLTAGEFLALAGAQLVPEGRA